MNGDGGFGLGVISFAETGAQPANFRLIRPSERTAILTSFLLITSPSQEAILQI